MPEQELLEIISIFKRIKGSPSSAELEVLKQFKGWGAYWRIFNPEHRLHQKLKELLSPEEYAIANGAILNSYFTDQSVAMRITEILRQLGVSQDHDLRILEPSCGIGNLMHQPFSAKFYGVELDPIAASMAKLLCPHSFIYNADYQSVLFPDNYFDCAIGNVPFGEEKIGKLSIHNYFIDKTIELLRPDGIAVLLTSRFTMDSKDSGFRYNLFSKASLIAAYRLPTSIFTQSANAAVTVDILILQKLLQKTASPCWIETDEVNGHTINCYFLEHPNHVLGEYKERNYQLIVEGSRFLALVNLNELIQRLAPTYNLKHKDTRNESWLAPPDFPKDIENKSFVIYHGNLFWYDNQEIKPLNYNNQIEQQIKICEQVQKVLQSRSAIEETEERAKLNTMYDSFVAQYGQIMRKENKFQQDCRWHLISKLEENGQKSAFLTENSKFLPEPTYPDPKSALLASLNKFGKVDIDWIAEHITPSDF